MAAQTQRIFEAQNGTVTVDVTFDNVTGEVTGVAWDAASGTLTLTITRPAQQTLTLTRSNTGSAPVPAGRFFLVQDRGGGWAWRQTNIDINWAPPPQAQASTKTQ